MFSFEICTSTRRMKLTLEGNKTVSNRPGEQVIFLLLISFFDFMYMYIFITLFKYNSEGCVIDVEMDSQSAN